jgi:hypothetical protein
MCLVKTKPEEKRNYNIKEIDFILFFWHAAGT